MHTREVATATAAGDIYTTPEKSSFTGSSFMRAEYGVPACQLTMVNTDTSPLLAKPHGYMSINDT